MTNRQNVARWWETKATHCWHQSVLYYLRPGRHTSHLVAPTSAPPHALSVAQQNYAGLLQAPLIQSDLHVKKRSPWVGHSAFQCAGEWTHILVYIHKPILNWPITMYSQCRIKLGATGCRSTGDRNFWGPQFAGREKIVYAVCNDNCKIYSTNVATEINTNSFL